MYTFESIQDCARRDCSTLGVEKGTGSSTAIYTLEFLLVSLYQQAGIDTVYQPER